MKFFIAFIFFPCAAGFTTIKAQSIKLPADCKKILKGEFRSYQPTPGKANLIKGDWNGDGKMDYAVLIKRKQNSNENSSNILTIAFLRSSKSYRRYILEGGDYLDVMKKGAKDYSYDWQRNFRYKNDAIFVGIGECCGSSYIWRNSKFISIVTSD